MFILRLLSGDYYCGREGFRYVFTPYHCDAERLKISKAMKLRDLFDVFCVIERVTGRKVSR